MPGEVDQLVVRGTSLLSPLFRGRLRRLIPQKHLRRFLDLPLPLIRDSAIKRNGEDSAECDRSLRLALRLADIDPRTGLGLALRSSVADAHREKDSFSTLADTLAHHVATTPTQTLSASQWRIIVAACSAHGFLHASLEARSKCRDLDIESTADLRRYVVALVDRDGGSARWHDRASSAIADDPWLTFYLRLLRGAAPAENPHQNYLDSLVAGRLVALVGSAVMNSGLGAKIDSHEIVARTKYLGTAFAQPASDVGRKTTITYFNKASVALVDSASGAGCGFPSPDLSDLALIVSKRPVESTGIPQLPLRVACPTFLGPALLGTRAILHLLAARPRALSVFGMDFYLADQPHYPGDLNERDRAARGAVRDNAHYCLAFAQHDPFSQIRFVRHLAEAGAITPYGRTAEVLAMTDLEYAKGLEARYGRWDRP